MCIFQLGLLVRHFPFLLFSRSPHALDILNLGLGGLPISRIFTYCHIVLEGDFGYGVILSLAKFWAITRTIGYSESR